MMVVSWELSKTADVSGECDLCLSCSGVAAVATSSSSVSSESGAVVVVFVVDVPDTAFVVVVGVTAVAAAAALLGDGDDGAVDGAVEIAAERQALLAGGAPAGCWSGLAFSLPSSARLRARLEEGEGEDSPLCTLSWPEALAALRRDLEAGEFALTSSVANARLLVGEASMVSFCLLLFCWCLLLAVSVMSRHFPLSS